MDSMKSIELNQSPDGLPRRRAIQGIAGSLAGIAALGAVSGSAKNKKKKKKQSTKGTLVRFQTVEESESIAPATTTEVTANCPAAGANEQVFATGGGYETAQLGITIFTHTSQVTGNGQGWEVTFFNSAGVAQNATVSVVCAFFKT